MCHDDLSPRYIFVAPLFGPKGLYDVTNVVQFFRSDVAHRQRAHVVLAKGRPHHVIGIMSDASHLVVSNRHEVTRLPFTTETPGFFNRILTINYLESHRIGHTFVDLDSLFSH